jgi:hypothetical protein
MTNTRPWTVTAGCALSVAIFAWDIVSLTALGVLAVAFLMQLGAEVAPIAAETLYSIAEVTSVVLLFVPASNAWYRNRFAAEKVRP